MVNEFYPFHMPAVISFQLGTRNYLPQFEWDENFRKNIWFAMKPGPTLELGRLCYKYGEEGIEKTYLNELIIRNRDLNLIKLDITIDREHIDQFSGDCKPFSRYS